VSKDIKRMVAEIRSALDAYPREQLQEILAWVFKEYVVEGGTAPAQGALAMLDARSELEGLSFAEVVTWLQLHLDVPELAALEVQGARVSVRAGGRAIPIEVAAPPPPPPIAAPTPPPAPVAAPTVAANPIAPTPPVAAPSPTPAPSAEAKPDAKADDKKDEASSRFSWLEVD
jgi:outer membrane biosynthesis protein TonB